MSTVVLSELGPLIGSPCPACDLPLVGGDVVTLVYVGPGDDRETWERAQAGHWHSGAAVAVHEFCSGSGAV